MAQHRQKSVWTMLFSRRVQFVLDIFVLSIVFILSYFLRFEFRIPPHQLHPMLTQLPMVLFFQFVALYFAGVYTFIWRYIGLTELGAFVKASIGSALPLLALRLVLPSQFQNWRIPLSILVMDTVFAFGGVLTLRVVRRMIYEHFEKRNDARGNHIQKKPVLLVGAGRAGVLALRDIRSRGDVSIDVKGFIDDNPEKQGAVILGVRVLGTTRDIPRLVKELGIDRVIITIASATRKDIRRIVDICEHTHVRVQIIPPYSEIVSGRVEVSDIRDVEIEDLLGREPIHLDDELLQEYIKDRTILVTGAGGSIGSEIVRQVAFFGANKVIMVERAEFALFDIDRKVREVYHETEFVPVVGDSGDIHLMRVVFRKYRPDVVLHAAAHKHVPMMEFNPCEAVKNNVFATHVMGTLAGEMGCDSFVLISTDKAVKPRSVMGASKRVAELVVQHLANRYPTRFVAVRFGNVMGSAGSVIPIFREQIRKGGPVTVTHPDVVRYFMTVEEAVQLVLQAGAMGKGGEIFILDMGEPVRILDLARDMITLSGLKPYEDIDIVFTGLRPGEKLFEELEREGENVEKTRHPKILIGKISPYPDDVLQRGLEELKNLVVRGDGRAVREFLNEFIPEAHLELTSPETLVNGSTHFEVERKTKGSKALKEQ